MNIKCCRYNWGSRSTYTVISFVFSENRYRYQSSSWRFARTSYDSACRRARMRSSLHGLGDLPCILFRFLTSSRSCNFRSKGSSPMSKSSFRHVMGPASSSSSLSPSGTASWLTTWTCAGIFLGFSNVNLMKIILRPVYLCMRRFLHIYWIMHHKNIPVLVFSQWWNYAKRNAQVSSNVELWWGSMQSFAKECILVRMRSFLRFIYRIIHACRFSAMFWNNAKVEVLFTWMWTPLSCALPTAPRPATRFPPLRFLLAMDAWYVVVVVLCWLYGVVYGLTLT